MRYIIKAEPKVIYKTSNRDHRTRESAENEIIEQNIREEMITNFKSPRELEVVFGFIMNNKQLIKRVLNTEIVYE